MDELLLRNEPEASAQAPQRVSGEPAEAPPYLYPIGGADEKSLRMTVPPGVAGAVSGARPSATSRDTARTRWVMISVIVDVWLRTSPIVLAPRLRATLFDRE